MYINPDIRPGVMPLRPQGTNSTMFTECCGTAINDDERNCPKCKCKIIGSSAVSEGQRHRIRWQYATKHWRSK